jgi:DNA-binding PadR family transcriptional regulator
LCTGGRDHDGVLHRSFNDLLIALPHRLPRSTGRATISRLDVSNAGGCVVLTAAQFAILLALTQGDRHGYAIMRESGQDGLRLGPGTMYRSIKQLLEAELIAEVDGPADTDERGDRRRYYRLTASGRRVAEAEANRLARLVDRSKGRGLLMPNDGSQWPQARGRAVADGVG